MSRINCCASCYGPIDRECGVLDAGDLYHAACWESMTAKDRQREADEAEDRVLHPQPEPDTGISLLNGMSIGEGNSDELTDGLSGDAA